MLNFPSGSEAAPNGAIPILDRPLTLDLLGRMDDRFDSVPAVNVLSSTPGE